MVSSMTLAPFCPVNLSDVLCVYVNQENMVERASQFAQRLGLLLYSSGQIDNPASLSKPFVFVYDALCASIIQTGKAAPGPVSASFLQGKTTHRLKFGGGKGQMIAKAVGLNKGVVPTILDATAGLAQDAFVMASLGCQVTMLERSPMVAELIATALAESTDTELHAIIARMHLHEVNALEWLKAQQAHVADVIYLDPMYPQNDKSAMVKKEMHLFHSLVGGTPDDAELLAAALDKAKYRVVVKRPRKGVSIEGVQPAHQLIGKSCRYDIYPLQKMENLKR